MSRPNLILEQGHQRLILARHGYVLYNRNDTVIGRLIETCGEYFEPEVEVFRRFVSGGDVVLDIGANIGTHTLALARLAGAAGLVFAFEPQRLVFQTLCANIALNSLSNVHCVNAAVDEIPGRLALTDPNPEVSNNFGGVEVGQLGAGARQYTVDRLVLDDFLQLDRLKLVKIDVEGMEAAVLRGARRTLATLKPILYVENDRIEQSTELLALLREMDYRCYWHLPFYVGASNFFGETQLPFPIAFIDRGGDTLGAIGFAVNLLCVPASMNLAITGLRPADDLLEHPCKREYVGQFSGRDGARIPVLRE